MIKELNKKDFNKIDLFKKEIEMIYKEQRCHSYNPKLDVLREIYERYFPELKNEAKCCGNKNKWLQRISAIYINSEFYK